MTLRAGFLSQAQSCVAMGSPFMGQLLELLADHLPASGPLADKLDSFGGDIGPSGHSLPLRLAGGLHALVLSGRAPDLGAVYPPHAASEADLLMAVQNALEAHRDFLVAWMDSPPQTNEVRRSAALIAGARVAARHHDLPIVLSELGASGGLNLIWDRYALTIGARRFGPPDPVLTLAPDWKGALPPDVAPRVAQRAGVDLNPLNPADPTDMLRLMAYLWPDQPERLALTRIAAGAMDAPIARGDAIDWLATRLEEVPDGHLHLIQHTVAWQYFPAAARARGRALIEAAGAKATERAPLGWLALESDGDTTGRRGAALTLRLWPGDLRFDLGRADFHGRWINWTGPA